MTAKAQKRKHTR